MAFNAPYLPRYQLYSNKQLMQEEIREGLQLHYYIVKFGVQIKES